MITAKKALHDIYEHYMKDIELSQRFSDLDKGIEECRDSIALLSQKIDEIRQRLENPSNREFELERSIKNLKENKSE